MRGAPEPDWPDDVWRLLDHIEHHYRSYEEHRNLTETETETETDMNINDAFPSNYLRASDLQGRTVTVTISGCEMTTFQDGSSKPALSFQNKDKGMVLNKTNSQMIADSYGPDTDTWIGKPIELFSMRVQGPNGMTDGLRVKIPGGQSRPASAPVQSVGASPAPQDLDDDIPF